MRLLSAEQRADSWRRLIERSVNRYSRNRLLSTGPEVRVVIADDERPPIREKEPRVNRYAQNNRRAAKYTVGHLKQSMAESRRRRQVLAKQLAQCRPCVIRMRDLCAPVLKLCLAQQRLLPDTKPAPAQSPVSKEKCTKVTPRGYKNGGSWHNHDAKSERESTLPSIDDVVRLLMTPRSDRNNNASKSKPRALPMAPRKHKRHASTCSNGSSKRHKKSTTPSRHTRTKSTPPAVRRSTLRSPKSVDYTEFL